MKHSKVKKAFGTHDIARVCQVTPPTVIRWMEEGKLLFFTTGGGHRRVWDTDLADFMSSHNIPVPAALEARTKLKFLIVDDEADSRLLMKRLLRAAYPEAEIAEAADGFEAGHKVHSFLPTLITLDLNLPGVDGFRICELIRADEGLKGIKILAVTGYNHEDGKERVLGAGADDFLEKPFEAAVLAEKLENLLAHTQWAGRGGL